MSNSSPPRSSLIALVTAVASVLGVGLVAWALGAGATTRWGVPVVWACAALSFAVNWVVFAPSFAGKTERFYDLTGSLTYLAVTALALFAAGARDIRSVVIAILVAVWAVRLGTFLFHRVHADGGDGQFDEIKKSAPRFFIAWTLQAVWVFLTLAAALAAITTATPAAPDPWFGIGLATWLVGFTIEVVADAQKRRFRRQKDKPTEFITAGLWAWSRHPNYFGEIVLWIGIAAMAVPTLRGVQWVAMVSPLFVALLLIGGSGIPLLEKRADKRWGGQPEYESYKARTPILMLRPPRS